MTEFLVLRHLRAAPAQTLRRVDLAEQIGMSASGITRLLNPMEKIGLVEKEPSPRDARVSLVALSKAGKRVLKEVEVSFSATSKTLLKPMATQEQNALMELMGLVN